MQCLGGAPIDKASRLGERDCQRTQRELRQLTTTTTTSKTMNLRTRTLMALLSALYAAGLTPLSGLAHVETAGHSTDSPLGGNGTIPRWSAYNYVGYTTGNHEAFVGNRFIPAFVDANDGSRIGAWTTWDASVGYRFPKASDWRRYFGGARLSVGVNNVFDRMPPRDASIFTDSNADIATFGPIGRFVYVDMKFKF